MPNKRNRVITFPAPPEQVFTNAQQVIAEMTGKPAMADGFAVRGSMPTTFLSWGENLEAIVEPDQSGSRVTLWSRSALATQIFDWGKHAKNIDQLQQGLERSLGEQGQVIDHG